MSKAAVERIRGIVDRQQSDDNTKKKVDALYTEITQNEETRRKIDAVRKSLTTEQQKAIRELAEKRKEEIKAQPDPTEGRKVAHIETSLLAPTPAPGAQRKQEKKDEGFSIKGMFQTGLRKVLAFGSDMIMFTAHGIDWMFSTKITDFVDKYLKRNELQVNLYEKLDSYEIVNGGDEAAAIKKIETSFKQMSAKKHTDAASPDAFNTALLARTEAAHGRSFSLTHLAEEAEKMSKETAPIPAVQPQNPTPK